MKLAACFLVALIAGASPIHVEAQGESGGGGFSSSCGEFLMCGGGTGAHGMTTSPVGSNYNPHASCLICTTGDASDCHANCYVSLSPSTRDAYKAILVAAEHRDVKEIVALANSVQGYVNYNLARNALQISGCDKRSIVASIPVPSRLVQAVGKSIPTSVMQSSAFLVAVAGMQY